MILMILSIHLPMDWHRLADTINQSYSLEGRKEKVFAFFMYIRIDPVFIRHRWTCNP